ncbi:MAG: class I SAM-dependent methyltransferase [Pirellulaceae bacterium]|nr:methyltransferase domain-containing protein [Planctomycetales bacterium]
MMQDTGRTLGNYFALMHHHGASRVYDVALKTGMLDALARQSLDTEPLACSCGLDVRATELLIQTLVVLGLVERVENQWSATTFCRMLIGGPYRTLGDPYWDHLGEFLKTGKPIVRMDSTTESESHYRTQAEALAWMQGPVAAAAANKLGYAPGSTPCRILDVGAGSAVWSLTFAAYDGCSTVTAVDWPGVLPVAEQFAARLGISDRLSTIAGDLHQVEIPENSFDIAIVANVTHLETRDGNRDLLARVHRALTPGGQIYVIDVLPGQPEGDLNRTLYTIGLALRTEHGHVYSPEDLNQLLHEAGFSDPRPVALPAPPHAIGMIVATR